MFFTIQPKALQDLASLTLSLISPAASFPLARSVQLHWPLFFEHAEYTSTLQPLHLLFLLPRTLVPQISV